jgi:putative ABC transport system substrate-binding protein
MRRREFLWLLGGGAAARVTPEAWSQEAGRTYRLGALAQSPRSAAHWVAFFDELRKSGFIEGENLSVTGKFSAPLDRADTIAAELVRAGPDAIATGGAALTRALQRATQTIPILSFSDNLVAEKAVASLGHPGGNITGISILASELDGKRQEILIEMLSGVHRIAALADPAVTTRQQLEPLENAARARGIALSIQTAADTEDILPAIDAALAAGAQGLNVLASSLFNASRARIEEHTTSIRLPAIYQWPEMAEEGGLVAYGPRFVSLYRQYALQMVKVLKGTKPADIPVEQPTKFELVINLKTAKALGLTIPATLVLRADELIE